MSKNVRFCILKPKNIKITAYYVIDLKPFLNLKREIRIKKCLYLKPRLYSSPASIVFFRFLAALVFESRFYSRHSSICESTVLLSASVIYKSFVYEIHLSKFHHNISSLSFYNLHKSIINQFLVNKNH